MHLSDSAVKHVCFDVFVRTPTVKHVFFNVFVWNSRVSCVSSKAYLSCKQCVDKRPKCYRFDSVRSALIMDPISKLFISLVVLRNTAAVVILASY